MIEFFVLLISSVYNRTDTDNQGLDTDRPS